MEHIFQQMNKPPPIVKNIEITLEQAYSGGSIQLAIEKQVMHNMERVTETEIMTLEIPAGIDENEVMVLRDQGHIMNNNVRGDVKLTIQIKNNTIFKRQGMDLIYNKILSLKESLCGFSFEIAHLNGKILNMNNMTNSAVIKPNYTKVVPGFGMNKNGQTGNLIIEMTVEFPDILTKEQIEALQNIL
jgi:DnaJ-class molecular chaperone